METNSITSGRKDTMRYIMNNGGDIQSTTSFFFSYMPAELYTSFDSEDNRNTDGYKKCNNNKQKKNDIQFGIATHQYEMRVIHSLWFHLAC